MLDRNCEATIIILMILNYHSLACLYSWHNYYFYQICWIINFFFYTKARSTTALPNSFPLSPATNHLWSAKHQPWLSVYMYIKTMCSKKYYVKTYKNSHHWYGFFLDKKCLYEKCMFGNYWDNRNIPLSMWRRVKISNA